MRYKLVTLPKNTVRIPVVTVPNNSITLLAGQQDTIIPSTINYRDGNTTYGYTAILADSDVVSLEVVEASAATTNFTTPPLALLEPGQSVSLAGKSFRIVGREAPIVDKTTTLTIYGNETGGQTVINITVQKETTSNRGSLTN